MLGLIFGIYCLLGLVFYIYCYIKYNNIIGMKLEFILLHFLFIVIIWPYALIMEYRDSKYQ